MEDLYIGVQTSDLPTITTPAIAGASINVGGLEGYFERGAVDGVYEFTNPDALQSKLGKFKSSYYGMYVAKSFFENLQGQSGKLLIQRLNRTGSAAATGTINDVQGSPEPAVAITAGQLGKTDPGAWGNQLGYLVLASSRGASTVAVAGLTGDTFIKVDSVAPFAVSDWVKIGASIYRKVTAIDETTNTLTLNATLGAGVAEDVAVAIEDRTLRIYIKDSLTGQISLVETLSNWNIETDSPYYFSTRINDKFIGSSYIKVSDSITDAPRTVSNFPAGQVDAEANIVYLTGGVEGTALTESQVVTQRIYWRDAKPLFLANAEHFTETLYDDAELYCYNGGKGDITFIGSPTKGMTYAQGKDWAQRRRKSRKIAALNNLNWISVDDPIGNPLQPRKDIPNVGAIMGYWIYSSTLRGIHKVPAGRFEVLAGVRGIVGEVTKRDEFTDLANIGLNIISNLDNNFTIRSARTPSKLPEWRFANALLMSSFFKRSFENSLQDLENETNSAQLFGKVASAMRDFAEVVYAESTNGGSESGFANFIKPGGSQSGFEDVVKIVVDETINSQEQINNGELRANFYFMPPKPAERILVGVGLIYSVA